MGSMIATLVLVWIIASIPATLIVLALIRGGSDRSGGDV